MNYKYGTKSYRKYGDYKINYDWIDDWVDLLNDKSNELNSERIKRKRKEKIQKLKNL